MFLNLNFIDLVSPKDLRFFHFLEQIGAYAAEGAFVVFGQLVALVDILTYCADKFFHTVSPLSFSLAMHLLHNPVKLS